ncbi:hypothetical protein HDU97_001361 [Phlyctochytrium planicorne]|nr:hypothetical protein HDU97_001361 [Phlyctochytrium planicorne]
MFIFSILIVLLLGLARHSTATLVLKSSPKTLEFGYGCGGQCEDHYRWLLEQYSTVRVDLTILQFQNPNFSLPEFVPALFKNNVAPDMLSTLPAAARQKSLLDAGLLANLTSIYSKYPWNEFPASYKNICTYRNETSNATMQFCIPISIFAQKVLYRPSVFQYNKVAVPTTFTELLDACDAFYSKGKSLIFFGVREAVFPTQYIFTALFTRLWSASLYEKLLLGNLSWRSAEVNATMDAWKQMIDRHCFAAPNVAKTFDFGSVLFFFLCMDFWMWWGPPASSATYAITIMPSWYNWFKGDNTETLINNDIPSMPFPAIRTKFTRTEVISAEAISVSSRSGNLTASLELLEFMSGVEAQKHGLQMGAVSSPFIQGLGASNYTDFQFLSSADNLVLWFDGIAGSQVSEMAYAYFAEFFLNQTKWPERAKALDDMVLELNFQTTPAPDVFIDRTKSGGILVPSIKNTTITTDQVFLENATIVLTPTTKNALIFYTIDGTDPISGVSTLYQKPIVLNAPRTFSPVTYTVKAISFKPGLDKASSIQNLTVTVQRNAAICSSCVYGTCVDDEVCRCDPFHFNDVFANCSEAIPINFVTVNLSLGLGVAVLNTVLMVAYGVIGVLFVVYYNNKVVRSATSPSMILIVVGCMISSSALYFFMQEPTEASCVIRPWLFSVGFGLVWGNILAKGYRIYRLFNNTRGKSITITNRTVFLWSSIITGVDVVLCLIYTFAYRPKLSYRIGPTRIELTCRSDDANAEVILLSVFMAYNGFLVACGVALAFMTRNVSSDYSESQILGYTTFTFCIVSVVTLPLFLLPGMDYTSRFGLVSGITFLLTAIIMFLFCGSKIVNLGRDLGYVRVTASKEYAPVLPTILRSSGTQKDDDERIVSGTQFLSTRLFFQQPGILTRWIECVFIRIPSFNLVYVTRVDSAVTILSAAITDCRMGEIGEVNGVWVGVLCLPGKRTLKVQSKDRKVLEELLGNEEERERLERRKGRKNLGDGIVSL